MKKYVIAGLVVYWAMMIFMHASAANDLEKAAKDLTKHYVKEVAKEYVDFTNPYIKYGAGSISVITKKEIDFNITDNTDISISEDSVLLTFKKTF